MSSNSLKDIVRKIVFDRLKEHFKPRVNAVFITDTDSDHLIRECKVSDDDLLGLGIRELATLNSKRPEHKDEYGYVWIAIYFVTPKSEIVDGILNDFTGPKSLYQHVHLYFTSPLADAYASRILNSPAKPYIETFVDLYLDFIPFESRVFHTGQSSSLTDLYHAQSKDEIDYVLSKMAVNFRGVLSALNEAPEIRYYDPTGKNESLSARFAKMIQREVAEIKKYDPSFPLPTAYDYHGPATLVIVDRSIDVLAPLVHSLGYQALGWSDFDVLNDKTSGVSKSIIEVVVDDGVQPAIFDESDEIFASIRHMIFFDAAAEVARQLKEHIISQNDRDLKGDEALDSLRDKIVNLAAYQRRNDQILALESLNSEIVQSLLDRKMKEVVDLEQSLLTGEDADGKPLRNTFRLLEQVMENEDVPQEDKLRVLAIYIVTVDGIKADVLKSLMDKAGFEPSDRSFLTGLRFFGINQDGDRKETSYVTNPYSCKLRKDKSRAPGQSSYWSLFGKKQSDAGAALVDEGFGHLDRFEPAISYIVDDLVNGKCKFPVLPESVKKRGGFDGRGDTPVRRNDSNSRGKGTVMDFRTGTRPSWAKKRIKTEDGEDYRHNGPRIIFIVLGGLTFPEIRAVYASAKKWGREIIIGSTQLITPIDFVQAAYDLGKLSVEPFVYPNLLDPSLNKDQQPVASDSNQGGLFSSLSSLSLNSATPPSPQTVETAPQAQPAANNSKPTPSVQVHRSTSEQARNPAPELPQSSEVRRHNSDGTSPASSAVAASSPVSPAGSTRSPVPPRRPISHVPAPPLDIMQNAAKYGQQATQVNVSVAPPRTSVPQVAPPRSISSPRNTPPAPFGVVDAPPQIYSAVPVAASYPAAPSTPLSYTTATPSPIQQLQTPPQPPTAMYAQPRPVTYMNVPSPKSPPQPVRRTDTVAMVSSGAFTPDFIKEQEEIYRKLQASNAGGSGGGGGSSGGGSSGGGSGGGGSGGGGSGGGSFTGSGGAAGHAYYQHSPAYPQQHHDYPQHPLPPQAYPPQVPPQHPLPPQAYPPQVPPPHSYPHGFPPQAPIPYGYPQQGPGVFNPSAQYPGYAPHQYYQPPPPPGPPPAPGSTPPGGYGQGGAYGGQQQQPPPRRH